MKIQAILISSVLLERSARAFQPTPSSTARASHHHASKDIITSMLQTSDDNSVSEKEKHRANVMTFLRKKGAVGKNKDFSTAMGVDEGPVGKNRSEVMGMQKAKDAYQWCTDTGIIDDISETFPLTSSGSEWAGFTDQVAGGESIGKLLRSEIDGRQCNIMTGKVSTFNDGGFIQMATELSKDPAQTLTVDASEWDGVELDVYFRGEQEKENFDVHIKNTSCERRFGCSYRATFEVHPGEWQTVRLPFTEFAGHGPGADESKFVRSELRRLSIVAIGKPMEVCFGIGKVAFYKDK